MAAQVVSVSAASLLDTLGVGTTPAASYPNDADVDLRAIFESRRPVRPLIKSGQSATIPMRTLNSELTCPVCLGIIQQCTAVMECLHRFCSACIEKSLRFGKKEDAAFDSVIRAIYPDINKAEATQETYIQEVIKSYNVRKFGEIATKGARQQRDQAKRSAKRPASPPPSSAQSHSAQLPLSKRPRNPSKPEPISFSLVQHPSLSESSQLGPAFLLQNKFVRTSRYITVLLLKKWLQLKLVTDKERAKKEQAAATATTTDATHASATEATTTSEEKKSEAPSVETTNDQPKTADAGADGAPAAADATTAPVSGETGVASDSSAAVPSAAASSTSSHPPVRFVLYVRAFDVSLLSAGSDATVPTPLSPVGEETFVPLASDLTLDYIEDHMWHTDRQTNAAATDQLNQSLQSLPAEADIAQLVQPGFAQSFAKCPSHRKSKSVCPEDCAERVAAWAEYLARETEKINKWRADNAAAQQTAAENAIAAANAAAASNGAVDPNAAAAAAFAATPQPPPAFTPQPIKKRRLVLYYSVVGADGQILLDAPTIAPDITARYVIPEKREDDEEDDAEGHQPNDTEGNSTTPVAEAAPTAAPPPPQEQTEPMQMDEADAPAPAVTVAAGDQ